MLPRIGRTASAKDRVFCPTLHPRQCDRPGGDCRWDRLVEDLPSRVSTAGSWAATVDAASFRVRRRASRRESATSNLPPPPQQMVLLSTKDERGAHLDGLGHLFPIWPRPGSDCGHFADGLRLTSGPARPNRFWRLRTRYSLQFRRRDESTARSTMISWPRESNLYACAAARQNGRNPVVPAASKWQLPRRCATLAHDA